MTGVKEPLFRSEALDFQRERLWGEVILTQPVSLRHFTVALVVVMILLILYLSLATYTRKETVVGFLKPEGGVVQVFAPQTGRVVELYVEGGTMVKEGDPLMRLRSDITLEDGQSVARVMTDLLKDQKDRLQLRIERQQEQRESQRRYLQQSIAGIKDQLQKKESQILLQNERVEVTREDYESLGEMMRNNMVSSDYVRSRQQSFLEAREEQEALQQSIIAEKGRLDKVLYDLSSLDADVENEIDRLRSDINSLEQRIAKESGIDGTIIRAPAAGYVTSMQASAGNRVQMDRPLMAILPEGASLQIELLLPTHAIGFVTEQLEINIRYHAFPYERFGAHQGKIVNVSRTVLSPHELIAPMNVDQPVYLATATPDQQVISAYGETLPLRAGMTLDADIRLDERPLYQWLLRPLLSLEGTL
jgi:membrane fusion protein